MNPEWGNVYAYHRLGGGSRLCYVGTTNLRRYVRLLMNIRGLRRYVPTVFANVRFVDRDGVPSALNYDPVYTEKKELERLCETSVELCESAVEAIGELYERAREVLEKTRRGARK